MSLLDKINEVPEPEPSSSLWLWIIGGMILAGIVFVVVTYHTANIELDTVPNQVIPIDTETQNDTV